MVQVVTRRKGATPAQTAPSIAVDLMGQARAKLLEIRPYYRAEVFARRYVETAGLGTCAADKWARVYYDPVALEKWTPEHRAAVLEHELSHGMRVHHARIPPGCHPDAWNVVADAAINDDIGAARLPADAIFPAMLKDKDTGEPLPEGLCEEEYLARVVRDGPGLDGQPGDPNDKDGNRQPEDGDGKGNKPGKKPGDKPPEGGSASDGKDRWWELGPPTKEHPAPSPAALDAARRKVAEDIREHVKRRGTVPAGLARWADLVLAPRVAAWQKQLDAVLRGDLSRRGFQDQTHARPSRRSPPGIMLPSWRAFKPTVALVGDTSGSMGTEDLAQVINDARDVTHALGAPVRVWACDARAVDMGSTTLTGDIAAGLIGGGGTDMRVGIEAALAARPRPDVVVVITDGGTPWPDHRLPGGVTLVVALTQPDAPRPPAWARVIEAHRTMVRAP